MIVISLQRRLDKVLKVGKASAFGLHAARSTHPSTSLLATSANFRIAGRDLPSQTFSLVPDSRRLFSRSDGLLHPKAQKMEKLGAPVSPALLERRAWRGLRCFTEEKNSQRAVAALCQARLPARARVP